MRLGLPALCLVAIVVGCEKPQPSTAWTAVDESQLDEGQRAAVEAARAEQQELGRSLVGALSASIAEKGVAASVDVCRVEAPRLTAAAAQKGISLGRTSHRLRNPQNVPPAWATATVASQAAAPHVFLAPDGRLGVLSPIMTAELCVNCHGAPDKLAPGVPEALATAYPNDRATGFAPGELRGWFWAETSAP